MSAEADPQRSTTFSRVLIGGTLVFLGLLVLILAVGIGLALSDRGELGSWLRALRDFLAIALLLEATLLVLAGIAFLWRMNRFVAELAVELSALSGDARETAQIARESIQTLHQHLIQPLLYVRALWLELRELLRAWAGIKRATEGDEALDSAQSQPGSS